MPEQEDVKVEKINFSEKSRAQIISSRGRELTNPLPASYKTYRTMGTQPTLSLAQALVAAPVVAGSWAVEADDDVKNPDDKIQFIHDQLDPHRETIIETAMNGGAKFGWQPYELVYARENGKIILHNPKPLLQDITTILVEQETGAFWGYKQTTSGGTSVLIEKRYAMLINFRVEGTQWHGTSLYENARETYNQWREASEGAERYDAKMAGSHWVVHYPVGTSPLDEVETDNATIANNLLDALESSGSAAVPTSIAAHITEMSNANPMWKVEIMEDKGGRQPTFVDRLKYLDAMLVRSLLIPERAILEGEFGTKAEAGVHADLAVTMVTLWDRHIANSVNKQPVDELLEQNYGKALRGKVYIVPAPLTDPQISFLRTVYEKILSNPATMLEEFATINTDALKDKLGLPKSEEVAKGGEEPGAGLSLEERMRLVANDVAAALSLPIGENING